VIRYTNLWTEPVARNGQGGPFLALHTNLSFPTRVLGHGYQLPEPTQSALMLPISAVGLGKNGHMADMRLTRRPQLRCKLTAMLCRRIVRLPSQAGSDVFAIIDILSWRLGGHVTDTRTQKKLFVFQLRRKPRWSTNPLMLYQLGVQWSSVISAVFS
jgi:hypothetical protein